MKNYQHEYEAACEKLGISTQLPDVTGMTERDADRTIAGHVLDKIIDARNMDANDGKPWIAELGDRKQRKYHPLFVVEEDEAAPRGFRLAFYVYDYGDGCADLGARHSCKNSDIAVNMGRTYPDLYKDYKS